MRWPLALIIGVVTAMLLSGSEWKKMSSPNFELYTTSSEREARQTLEIFERTRDFFLRAKPASLSAQLPVTLVAFDTPREYQPYSPRAFTPAYSTGDEQRDYVVMSDLGAMRTRAAIHEYVHVLVRDSGYRVPLWLNEGMADVYSTLETGDGKVYIGGIPRDRNYSLTHEQWMHLPTLVNVGASSREYNEQDRAGIFYAQSWLLAHMLMLGDGYSAKFPQFLDQFLGEATLSQQAFSTVYGKTLAEIEREMGAYFRQSTIGGAAVRFEFQKVEIGPPAAVSELETGLVLAKLIAFQGRVEEAERRLDALLADHPNHPDVEESLAYVDWRKGDRQGSASYFEKAIADGAKSWKTNWDYARLLVSMGRDSKSVVPVLRKGLELKPDLAEARVLLAQELYQSGQYGDALAELQRIQNPDPRNATAAFVLMGYASARMNRPEDARRYAEEARKSARTPDESAQVEQLLQDLERKPRVVVEPTTNLSPAPTSVEDPGRPTLRRREPPKRK